MNPPSAPPRFLGMSPMLAAAAVIAATTLFRFFYSAWLPLLPDEAYYFQWSKHLDASYISKGPAVAWTIAAGTAMFGDNNFGIRFFAVLLSAGTAWQIFLLARRWYDETVGLIAVLVTGVVPLYAVGAVVMTIDPLSAFFWVWAANLFSRAVQENRLLDWLLAGFAVGSGFLAKYLNALELVTFLAFLLIVPERRKLLAGPGFWSMLGVTVLCATPVLWWNHAHGWITAGQLQHRGKLDGPFDVHSSSFIEFLRDQALVLSPLLFLALMLTAWVRWAAKKDSSSQGELLLLLLFLPVFLMYATLSWHMRCEPNWPAVSYLSLIVVLAARWKDLLYFGDKFRKTLIAVTFLLAWLMTTLMHDTLDLPLPKKYDPMSRVAGWSDIAAKLDEVRKEQHADVLIADAYKEASIFSYHLPGQPFIYTIRSTPPASQYDLWPGFPTGPDHRTLWITLTGETTTAVLAHDFNTFTPVAYIDFSYKGEPLRKYTIYLCEKR